MGNELRRMIYEMRHPFSLRQTRLEIDRDGRVSLICRRMEDAQSFSDQLPADELDSLYRLIEGSSPCDFRPRQRPVLPDDAHLEIQLVYDDQSRLFRGNASGLEPSQRKQMEALLSEFDRIIKRASAGKFEY